MLIHPIKLESRVAELLERSRDRSNPLARAVSETVSANNSLKLCCIYLSSQMSGSRLVSYSDFLVSAESLARAFSMAIEVLHHDVAYLDPAP